MIKMKIYFTLLSLFFVSFYSYSQDFYFGNGLDFNVQTSVTFVGNVTFENGSNFSSSTASDVMLKGDLITSGQLTNLGTFKFNNVAVKTVSGPIVSKKIVFESGSSIDLSGLGDLKITDSLILSNGKIKTNANIVELGTSSVNTGLLVHTTGYIEGNFKRWFADAIVSNVLFPLGSTTLYAPAELSFTTAPTNGGALVAKHIFNSSNPIISTSLVDGFETIENVSEMNIWQIDALNGLAGGEYSLKLNSNIVYGVTDQSALRIVKRTGTSGAWLLEGNHLLGGGTNTSPIMNRTNLTSFSQFAIGSPIINSLPITLTHFSSNCKENGIELVWQTASEHNSTNFKVLKSFDGITWDEIALVEAAGNSNQLIDYSIMDNTAINRLSYYRLYQTDIQGTTYQYETISANCIFEDVSSVRIYPNPTNTMVNIALNVKNEGLIKVNIFSVDGVKVYSFEEDEVTGNIVIPVDIVNNLPGLYQIDIVMNDQTFTEKLIKL
jgi:hypothetical protein